MTLTETATIEQLVERAAALASAGGRRMLGIVGAPGSGKSTLAAELSRALGDRAVLVPMDGFHLSNDELVRLGRRDRKGAADTFDVDGYVELLQRLRNQTSGTVYAPAFDRASEQSIGGAIAVPPGIPLVITEGNYLLSTANGWERVAGMLDESWYLAVDAELRTARLVARRVSFGDSSTDAAAWVRDVDQANAALTESTRDRADLIVRLTTRL